MAQKRGNAFKSFGKNPKWTVRDHVAQKRGDAFKSFGKNPKWTVRDHVAQKRGDAFKSFGKIWLVFFASPLLERVPGGIAASIVADFPHRESAVKVLATAWRTFRMFV